LIKILSAPRCKEGRIAGYVNEVATTKTDKKVSKLSLLLIASYFDFPGFLAVTR
jgi:hypothetical protein